MAGCEFLKQSREPAVGFVEPNGAEGAKGAKGAKGVMLAMPGRGGRDRSGFKSRRDEATGAGADLRRASSLLRVGRTPDKERDEEAEGGRADTFVAVFGGQIKTNFVGCSETGVGRQ